MQRSCSYHSLALEHLMMHKCTVSEIPTPHWQLECQSLIPAPGNSHLKESLCLACNITFTQVSQGCNSGRTLGFAQVLYHTAR